MNYANALFSDARSMALTMGVSTVILTHVALISLPAPLEKASKSGHAVLNLVAAGAIVWGSRLIGS